MRCPKCADRGVVRVATITGIPPMRYWLDDDAPPMRESLNEIACGCAAGRRYMKAFPNDAATRAAKAGRKLTP